MADNNMNDINTQETQELPENCIQVHYTKLQKDRILYCEKCHAQTAHELIRLIAPANNEELYSLMSNNYEFNKSVREVKKHDYVIGEHLKSKYILLNKCRSCSSYIVDMCKEGKQSMVIVRRLFPQVRHSELPEPNQDMPPNCLKTYKEAAEVYSISPRASAGLMRLCLQQFLVKLGITGNKLDDQIGALAQAEVPEFVRQYMDLCRVVGNSGVHPTVEMNVDEDPEIAKGLFQAMNIIVQHLITIPREAREAYDKLPKGAIRHIEQRDSKTSKK